MARITIEDCAAKVASPFELVLLAAERAREFSEGELSRVPIDNDKPVVVALREIATGDVEPESLRKNALQRLYRVDVREPEPNDDGYSGDLGPGQTHARDPRELIDYEEPLRQAWDDADNAAYAE